VNKNAMLCTSLDELFEKGMSEVDQSALRGLMQKTGFDMKEILRKYIRYVLNEKPFNPDLVANLIHLRKETQLDDSEVAGILNEISERIVRDKGPVVMDMSGYSEKGFKRKLAVQALFGKIYYLSELPEFCSRDSSLNVKTTFGVTDEDAEKLRLHTVSEAGDMGSLEKMVGGSDGEGSTDDEAKAS
ncbi:ribosomal RNA small subunit methyltransferase J, partial [Perilla frutescens var. frutescens]